MVSDALAIRQQAELSIAQQFMPAVSIQQSVERFNAIVNFVKTVMKEGIDYGVVPGTDDKKTLKKPGAEKLCTLFGLTPEFHNISEVEDWQNGFFYYRYGCTLWRGDMAVVKNLQGSANSKEKKYRYRSLPVWKVNEEEKKNAIRVEKKKDRNNKEYTVYVFENTECYDLVNTLQKMAQKRALVAAVLVACNATEFFSQEIDDMIIDVDPEEGEEPKTKPSKEKTASTKADKSHRMDTIRAIKELATEICWSVKSLNDSFKLKFNKDCAETLSDEQLHSVLEGLQYKVIERGKIIAEIDKSLQLESELLGTEKQQHDFTTLNEKQLLELHQQIQQRLKQYVEIEPDESKPEGFE